VPAANRGYRFQYRKPPLLVADEAFPGRIHKLRKGRFDRNPSTPRQDPLTAGFSRQREPTDNAYIKSFNGRFRQECLNEHWFLILNDAREEIEKWRRDYNEFRLHSALGDLTPHEFIENFRKRMQSQKTSFLAGEIVRNQASSCLRLLQNMKATTIATPAEIAPNSSTKYLVAAVSTVNPANML
jgi:putative transposase